MKATIEIGLLVFLLFISGCTTMKSRWQEAQNQNTVQAYRSFLSEYPTGEHSTEARSRIEDILYSQASSTNTLEALERFLRDYPYGKHSQEARAKLDMLRAQRAEEAARKADEAAYAEFTRKRSVQTAAKYLRTYPKGGRSNDVHQWLKEQRVALPVSDSLLLVSLLGHQSVSQIEVPTGEMRFGPGESFTPQTKTLRPGKGNSFLILRLEITNFGPATSLGQKQIALFGKNGKSYTPIFWEQDLGLLSMRGQTFDIKDSIRINVMFDVPKNYWDILVLSIQGKRVASLSEFQKK